MKAQTGYLPIFLFLGASSAWANFVVPVPAAAGTWRAPQAATIDGSAFWANRSQDDGSTGKCNVGYWLQDTTWPVVSPTCNVNAANAKSGGPGKPLSFLSNSSSAANPVGWEFESRGPNPTSLQLEVAGFAGTNEFGYYTYDNNGNRVRHVVFAGPAKASTAPVVNITVATGEKFGFYLCPNGVCNSNTRYSGDKWTNPGAGKRTTAGKFALFSEIPAMPTNPASGSIVTKYWVGAEDSGDSVQEAFGDFQDILISATVLPEPGFYGMLALGMSGIALMVSRKRAS